MAPSLYVVRGGVAHTDPTYACVSHNTAPSRFVMIETNDEGNVSKRTIVPSDDIESVENSMNTFRGEVFVDDRTSDDLVPKPHCHRAAPADLDMFRSSKSDEELDKLSKLSKMTRSLVDTPGMSEAIFRGEAKDNDCKAYFKVHKGNGFTEYRGGMQSSEHLCSDLTRIVPKTAEWEQRLERVYRGFDRVEAAIEGGERSVPRLNALFRGCLDLDKDAVTESVLFHTGYESKEVYRKTNELNDYAFVTLGVPVTAVSNGVYRGSDRDTALVYRKTIQVHPVAPPSPTTPPPSSPRPSIPEAPPEPASPKQDTPTAEMAFRGQFVHDYDLLNRILQGEA